MAREFRLSPAGSGRGISCDAGGAFIGSTPLLKRVMAKNRESWAPRSNDELSNAISSDLGLPIDMSSRAGGLNAISRALNDGDIARAQVATVLLAVPEPPTISEGGDAHGGLIKFIRELHQSNLIKADWDPDEHPRWPAGAPEGQGGQFAPKGDSGTYQPSSAIQSDSVTTNVAGEPNRGASLIPVAANFREPRRTPEQCDEIYDSDMRICHSLRDKRDYFACKSSAAERLAACLRGKPLPPLTLPDPEYDFHSLPTEKPPHRWPSKPPWWTPFLLLPWWRLIPAA